MPEGQIVSDTSLHSMDESLMSNFDFMVHECLRKWNLDSSAKAHCCIFHRCVDAAYLICQDMANSPCDAKWTPHCGGQCAICLAMWATVPTSHCEVCGHNVWPAVHDMKTSSL
eukprot:gnl/MRDRNA2_/MRDRNA2_670_c0_seq1.p1 gnl/MRDRNA2_/MRDRNA2_670_c0~~gnl/MRDRNA2_/MRDRNA2_670_c0_seq1.p1  ORF type:complete len:125 (+),score=9.88 gnl/MRDRNA2_/MRDRNA2_670_c0_seq1:37-375(+)